MDRRSYLSGAFAGGVGLSVSLAGCMNVLGGDPGAHEDVVLDMPEEYDRLRDSRDGGHLIRPIHGDELADVTMEAPLQDRSLATREFVGERHVLLTFIFTRCQAVCVDLVANQVQIQARATDDGYADEIALMPTTIDPVYDTGERLETYSEELGADLTASNWFPLRPPAEDREPTILTEAFGEIVEYVPPEEREVHEGHGGNGHDDQEGHGGNGHDDQEGHGGNGHDDQEGHGEHAFIHHPSSYILANAAGYVERGYPRGAPNVAQLVEDVETLIDRW